MYKRQVCACFSAGNLRRVAESLRNQYPAAELFVAADDDWRTEGNPGMTKATEAAETVKGKLIVPDFGADRPDDDTDFNERCVRDGEWDRCLRVLANNLPALSRDSRHLLTGEFD